MGKRQILGAKQSTVVWMYSKSSKKMVVVVIKPLSACLGEQMGQE